MAALGLGDLFWCEQLPPSPRAAIALAERQIAAARATGAPVTVVGSSLGGYYATHLAEKHRLKAVLVNPAVVAHLSLAGFVGTQSNLYTGEAFDFKPEYIDELRAIEVPRISRPQDVLLLAETGDEVLDYREAVAYYAGAFQSVVQGGDHALSSFPEFVPDIVAWARGEAPAPAGAGP